MSRANISSVRRITAIWRSAAVWYRGRGLTGGSGSSSQPPELSQVEACGWKPSSQLRSSACIRLAVAMIIGVKPAQPCLHQARSAAALPFFTR